MPAIIVWLLGGLAALLEGLVPRILFILGIGFATFTGFQSALNTLKSQVISNMQGLPSMVVQVLSTCKVDQGVNLVLSAWLAVVAVKLTAGALTRLTMKGAT